MSVAGKVKALLGRAWARLSMKHRRHQRQMRDLLRRVPPVAGRRRRVLFWVPGGMPRMLHVEGAIAAALALRGLDVHAVICDGPFRACVRREIGSDKPISQWAEECGGCKRDSAHVLETLGIPYSFIGDYVSENSRSALWDHTATVTWNGLERLAHRQLDVGRNAASAVDRYLKGRALAGNEDVVREYAFSALVCAEAAMRAIEQVSPDRIYMSHGTYVDWGPALHAAQARGVPVTAWMASYLSGRFYFRHIEDRARIDFHNMSDRAWEQRRAMPLSGKEEARLNAFLDDRYQRRNSFDMKNLASYTGDGKSLRSRYARDPQKPVWGIVAHINWDAVRDYSPMAYSTFDEWMLATVRETVGIDNVQWLIKVHPAEAWDNPASGVERLVQKHFPRLPDHVRLIPATEKISPLDFFHLVDGGVTVYGTAGLEIALQGRPVIVAGEAHYGRKGFTYEGLTPQGYCALLREAAALSALDDRKRALARQYAYSYFIQRQIPLPVVHDPSSTWWQFQPDKRELLLPGRDPFIDFICERIMDGGDFVMDERLIGLIEAQA